jgi:uracil-DNA glycosylase family 4
MGLGFTGAGAAARAPVGKQSRAVVRISPADQSRLTCAQCTLDKEPLQHPKMLPTGAVQPVLYFLGEAPSKTDDELGEQFVGASGNFLRERIPETFLKHIRWNNTLRCRPPGARDPSGLEVACCRRLQVEDIEKTKPMIVVGFGDVPLEWMLGPDRALSNWRGRRLPVRVGTHTCWFYPIEHPTQVLRRMNDKKKGEAIFRCFEHDLDRLFGDCAEGIPDPYVEAPADYLKGIECFTEYGQAGLKHIEKRLWAIAENDHGLDIETNGRLRPYHPDAHIITIAAGTYEDTFTFPWHHPEAKWSPRDHKALRDIVFGYLMGPGRKWCHNVRMEQEWFTEAYGAVPLYSSKWGDTLGQAHVLDERPAKELDELTQLHFGFRLKDIHDVDVKNLHNTPLSKVLPYNATDTKYTDALRIIQADLLEAQGLTHVYDRLHSATPSFVQMQRKGVVRNVPAILELDKDLTKQEQKQVAKILTQKDVAAYTATGKPFGPGSNKNLVSFFRDYLKIPHPTAKRQGGAWHKSGGAKETTEKKYGVGEEYLAEFKHPVANMILDLRSIIKNHGYVTPLLPGGKYVHGDELVHASYSQYIARSGRSACSDPNQQNYPRREHKEIRRVVGAPPGHRFVAFDYGQLEWRIGAMASRDKVMAQELWDKKDIHGDWTDSIGVRFVPERVKENRKKIRDSIKQFWTFANLYGNLASGIAWDLSQEFGLNISEGDIIPYYEQFWDRYPALKAYQDKIISDYWLTGYVETVTGQRRHEPMKRNEIINHPFQGTAGHLVIDAQGRLAYKAWKEDRPSLQPIMNIHDDLSFYLPDATIEQDIEDIAREMVCTPFDFVNVPLTVEVSVGYNWCDKQEIGAFSSEDFT